MAQTAVAEQPADLASGLKPLASILAGKQATFDLSGRVELPIDGRSQTIEVSVIRYDDESFDLTLAHSEYAITIRRRADMTALALPKHGTVFIGKGEVASEDSLKPQSIAERLISDDSKLTQIRFGLGISCRRRHRRHFARSLCQCRC